MKISAVVLTKNEENNIVDCLESLSFCSEIIIIDDNSTDRTLELSKNFQVKVLKRDLNDDFSAQRNFGMENTSGEWVLFIDADERVTDELKKEIIYKITRKNIDGYYLRRKDIIFGKVIKHGEFGNIKFLRLVWGRKAKWQGKVHETLKIKGKIEVMDSYLMHYPHQTIREFIKEINLYTTIRSKELFEEGKKSNWLYIILYTKLKFFQNYIFKMGFLDGAEGLLLAFFMSFHSFLTRSKLWLLWQKRSST